MSGAHFSPRAIRANEDAVRQSFASHAGDEPEMLCRCRIGREVAPVFIRAILSEINRASTPETLHTSLLAVMGWMLATTVSSVPTGPERMKHLGRSMAVLEAEAVAYAMENNIVDPGKDAYGEMGGHA